MKKRALVSGGVGGIGSDIVDCFTSNGLEVLVVDINIKDGLKLERRYNGNARFFKMDVLDKESIGSFFNTIRNENLSITHFISLAGGALKEEFKGIEELNDTIINKSIELNLISHIVLARCVLPFLRHDSYNNKSITFVSSINAIMDFGLPAYSAAKSGLLGITKVLSAAYGKYNIRVNSLLPGTTLTTKTRNEPKDFTKYLKGSLLGRFASSKEIAEAVYCLSEHLTCVTGQSIIADCGQTVKGHYENY